MKKTILDFLQDEEAASAVEYAVMVLVVTVAIVSINNVGSKASCLFWNFSEELDVKPAVTE